MSNNEVYNDVVEAVFTKKPFKYFRQQYHIITTDYEAKYYQQWVDYILDKYNNYVTCGFTKDESKINSLMDGLEALVKNG